MKDPCKECIIKGNCSTFCKEKIWSIMDNEEASNLAEVQELFKKEEKKFERDFSARRNLMKYGPCNQCLIGPICSTLCDDKINHLTKEAAVEENKSYQDVTLEDLLRQLLREGMKIRKIEVVDGTIEGATKGT